MVVKDTWNSTYMVRRYGKPHGPTYKYMTQDVYMLPPTILPCKQIDTPNMRYLNSDFTPSKQPFKDTIDIERYNAHWYDYEPLYRTTNFIRDRHMTSVSSLTIKPLSNHFEWNDEKSD